MKTQKVKQKPGRKKIVREGEHKPFQINFFPVDLRKALNILAKQRDITLEKLVIDILRREITQQNQPT